MEQGQIKLLILVNEAGHGDVLVVREARFDAPGIVAAGVHPLLIFLVRMHVERERGKKA